MRNVGGGTWATSGMRWPEHGGQSVAHTRLEPERTSQLAYYGSRYGFDATQPLECVRQQRRHDAIPAERLPLFRRQAVHHNGWHNANHLGRQQRWQQ